MSRLSLRTLVKGLSEAALREFAEKWLSHGSGIPKARPDIVKACAKAMEREDAVAERLSPLPRKLGDLLDEFIRSPRGARGAAELFRARSDAFKSRFDLEACLAALQREGFLLPAKDLSWSDFGGDGWAVPGEIRDCVVAMRKRLERAVKDSLTLQGHLEANHFRARDCGDGKAGDHARKVYKFYLMDSSVEGRIAKLPASVREALDAVILRHGGILPYEDLGREFDDEDLPDADLLGKCLVDGLLGNVTSLELTRYGIQPIQRAVVAFQEVVLHRIKQSARERPPAVDSSLACEGTHATNVGRFLRELQTSRVQFTAGGELFKASKKRIAGLLLPLPGETMRADAMLDWIYRFCLHARLVDRRGERSLRPTEDGLAFERAELVEQEKKMLAHAIEDPGLPGEQFHQVRLRRIFLRFLRRAEPGQWQEIQFPAFLARNSYLSQIDSLRAKDYFAARFQGGGYVPTETVQHLVWNLLVWVKSRLFPLGLCDLGIREGRPVAIRLSRLGAAVLESEPANRAGGTRSSLIVNPDFEILVFPGDDVHEFVHLLDRFAHRLKSDHVHQFRLDRESMVRGLADGMTLRTVLRELQDRARAPIPQNVLYSIEEWARG